MAHAAAVRAMSRLLDRDVKATQATAVRTPELAVSVEDLVEGSRLLCDLEAIVIDQYLGGAENPQKRQVRQNLFEVSERGGCGRSGGEKLIVATMIYLDPEVLCSLLCLHCVIHSTRTTPKASRAFCTEATQGQYQVVVFLPTLRDHRSSC